MSLLRRHALLGLSRALDPAPFFASDPMLSSGWEVVSGPSGLYSAAVDKTFVCWQFVGLAGHKGVHVAAYDHATNTWSERYTVGNFMLQNDDHGHPALVRDADGYIHCYFGSHNSSQCYSVSNAPDDISGWTQRPSIPPNMTYPKPVLVGSTIHLFLRESSNSSRLKLGVSTMTPTAGIGAHSAVKILVDFGASTRCYTSECHLVGTDVHFTCSYTTLADTARKNVYYMIYNTVTGDMTNWDGSVTIASGSLPIDKALADASFMIFNHGSNDGDVPSLKFDSSGNAHVLVADGVSPTYALKHMVLSGGAWSAPATIASISDRIIGSAFVDAYCLVPGASGKMEAWYNGGDDLVRRVLSSGGVWGPAETIKAASTYATWRHAAVKDAHASLRTLFSENLGNAIDANAAALKLFVYGDTGPVAGAIDMSPVDPLDFSKVTMLLGGRHRNGATSIIDESKSSATSNFAGNLGIDSAQSPFAGGASLYADGVGDFATIPSNAAFSVAGTADFCIDGWLRPNETGRLQTIIGKRPASGTSEYILVQTAANQLQFLMWNAAGVVLNLTTAGTVGTGTWYFFTVSRVAGVTRVFLGPLGGTVSLEATGTQSAAPTNNATQLYIGRDVSNTSRDLKGWLADLRFRQGAGPTASFAAPTIWAPRQ